MSARKSGLQRSRSSSSIQQPLRLSRLPVRNSIQKPTRGLSFGRQEKSVDKNMTRSCSNLSEAPGLSRQRSGSIVRQTLCTPLTSRSGRISPHMSSLRKDTRPITDKHWLYDQTVKVRTFVAKNFPYLDHNSIKSGIPLELFVNLMDSYFKLIDKRIIITRENYVEEVPINLKRYRYLVNIKPSLMKTVNTPHSWPHVIAIMSWLTDIINQMNAPVNPTSELTAVVDDCIMNLYTEYIKNQDDSAEAPLMVDLRNKLGKLINTDDEEIKKIDAEIENLRLETETITQKRIAKQLEIDELQKKIKKINEFCDVYMKESETLEKEKKEQCAKYAMKITKMDQELIALRKKEEEVKTVVDSQPHSFAEKQELAQTIKDLQNTFKLREDRQKCQIELVTNYDFKLSDIKRQMETNAYQYNNIVSQLELIDPKFKELHVRESGFAKRDTEDEIKEAQRLVQEAINTLKQNLEVSEKEIKKSIEAQNQIDEEIKIVKKEEENAIKLEAELSIMNAHKIKEGEREIEKMSAEINVYENKFSTLKESRYDLKPLKDKLIQLEKKKLEQLEFKEDLKKRALDFFIQLDNRMANTRQDYMNIMEHITNATIAAQENAIASAAERIEILKATRKEVEGDDDDEN